jgi:hypothetical protein
MRTHADAYGGASTASSPRRSLYCWGVRPQVSGASGVRPVESSSTICECRPLSRRVVVQALEPGSGVSVVDSSTAGRPVAAPGLAGGHGDASCIRIGTVAGAEAAVRTLDSSRSEAQSGPKHATEPFTGTRATVARCPINDYTRYEIGARAVGLVVALDYVRRRPGARQFGDGGRAGYGCSTASV